MVRRLMAYGLWLMAYGLWQELYAHLAGCDCPTGLGSIERPKGASYMPYATCHTLLGPRLTADR